MTISSSAFENNSKIPMDYTCDGDNTNPPLTFGEIPEETKSLAVAVEDPDAPSGHFTHWLIYNIPPDTQMLDEGEVPANAYQGLNDRGKPGYTGPCPPSGSHRYLFHLYALDTLLEEDRLPLEKFEDLIGGHIMAEAEIIGLYKRQ